MRITPFLCLNQLEISNDARTSAYVENIGLPGAKFSEDCACYAYADFYDTPTSDPAPWYEVTRPESTDFFGFYAHTANMPSAVMARTSTPAGQVGSAISPARLNSRVVQVQGTMLARSAEGMAYGERWLSEALRGSPCDSGCPGDDLVILPACPEYESYDADRYFRTLVNVGLIDGPVFTQINTLPECMIQQASFQLASELPWLYHPADRLLDAELISEMYGEPLSVPFTTPEWMGEGTFTIDVSNVDVVPTTDLMIQIRVSPDGTCPVGPPGTSIPPVYQYTIPNLEPEDRILIDGARRRIWYYDASTKTPTAGLGYIDFVGPWRWPDIQPCSTMCLTISSTGGDATVTVDGWLREV